MSAPRILIAEDDELFCTMLCLMLKQQRPHIHIRTAANGHIAQTLYEEHGADLILTDDHMPVMMGHELIRTLRAKNVTTPIILLSSLRTGQQAVGDDANCVFLLKPVLMADLLRVIDQYLYTFT